MSQTSAAIDRSAGTTVHFSLRPDPGVQGRETPDSWFAPSGPIRFDLDPYPPGFPQGWVLLSAKLSHMILDGSARLVLTTDDGEESIPVPVSAGGSVYEVIKLPRGIRRMTWEPSRKAGGFQHSAVTARKLGTAERIWLMIRRVLYMNWKQPAQTKARVGLAWRKALSDLAGQYAACGRVRSYLHDMPYDQWIERFDALVDSDRKRIGRRIARLRGAPHFAILVAGDGAVLERTLRSLDRQLYRNFSLLHLGSRFEADDYVCILQAGDQLAEHALYWVAEAIVATGGAVMAYSDEDSIDGNGQRVEPRFKPDWSPEHLRSINYLGRFVLFRGAELAAVGGIAPSGLADDGHELNLRVAGQLKNERVVHIPAVLFHRLSTNAQAKPVARARYPLPASAPLVSIIIPTRDREQLLRSCIRSVEELSTYRNFEILVVDNRSASEEALRYLAALKNPVLRYDHEFNYSAMNNLAVRAARGEVLLLLNNDTEVIAPDWLEEMLGHLHQDGVGVVGAKLLYSYGTVQHAGAVVGPGGCADHLHVGLERDAPGYCHRAIVAQELSAVTGACLMTWKSLYERLGGLDEVQLPVTFNDVDYCLRVQEAGYRVVFTPHAQLYHHESATRGRDLSREQQERAAREVKFMLRRWGRRMERDPYYNPNLSYARPDFSLSAAPRVQKPWRAA